MVGGLLLQVSSIRYDAAFRDFSNWVDAAGITLRWVRNQSMIAWHDWISIDFIHYSSGTTTVPGLRHLSQKMASLRRKIAVLNYPRQELFSVTGRFRSFVLRSCQFFGESHFLLFSRELRFGTQLWYSQMLPSFPSLQMNTKSSCSLHSWKIGISVSGTSENECPSAPPVTRGMASPTAT